MQSVKFLAFCCVAVAFVSGETAVLSFTGGDNSLLRTSACVAVAAFGGFCGLVAVRLSGPGSV